MTITVTKTRETKEEVNIETPAYFKEKSYCPYWCELTEHKFTQVSETLCLIRPQQDFVDISKYDSITKLEYEKVLQSFLNNLNS